MPQQGPGAWIQQLPIGCLSAMRCRFSSDDDPSDRQSHADIAPVASCCSPPKAQTPNRPKAVVAWGMAQVAHGCATTRVKTGCRPEGWALSPGHGGPFRSRRFNQHPRSRRSTIQLRSRHFDPSFPKPTLRPASSEGDASARQPQAGRAARQRTPGRRKEKGQANGLPFHPSGAGSSDYAAAFFSAIQRSTRFSSRSSGIAPPPSTVSWKPRMSNLSPSSASAFLRRSWILIMPIL